MFHTLHPSNDGKCLQKSSRTRRCSQAYAKEEKMMNSGTLNTDELNFDQEDNFHPLGNQILLSLISSQYQARLDVVHLIDGLDNACIRFVYFSLEDELKSKGFAEKMGLETGWNCHISLQSDGFVTESDHLMSSFQNTVVQQGYISHFQSLLLLVLIFET
ncbi:endoplasmic reticulum magnesium-transporting P-type ATPase-like [Heterodontus francisci]|uniref:endoplasmic reticulum magnesium-transporting P-type ATPase-like n=1 Tax=Heterodontus francisci TaxID=7792 RepID=UPI00355C499D